MEFADMCVENITANYSSFLKKCKDDEFICMVQKFSYTTSTENATSSQKLWSLERRCASNCEAGCIVIGERTKLYACTSCCKTSYCNTDKGAAKLSTTPNNQFETLFISIFIMIIAKLLATPNQYNNCWQLPGISLLCAVCVDDSMQTVWLMRQHQQHHQYYICIYLLLVTRNQVV